jgi:hypothetical protein
MGLAASSSFQDRASSLQILIANGLRFFIRWRKKRGLQTRPPKVQPRLHPLYSSFQPRASSPQNLNRKSGIRIATNL